MMFDGLGSSAAHIKGGRIKALAVAAEKRAPGFPDVPTSVEGGVPTYQVATWYGLWAPKGTPKELVEAMRAEMAKALSSDELRKTLDRPRHRDARPVRRRLRQVRQQRDQALGRGGEALGRGARMTSNYPARS